jgi:hypothetical protein
MDFQRRSKLYSSQVVSSPVKERVAGGGVPVIPVEEKKELIAFLTYFLGSFLLNCRTGMHFSFLSGHVLTLYPTVYDMNAALGLSGPFPSQKKKFSLYNSYSLLFSL